MSYRTESRPFDEIEDEEEGRKIEVSADEDDDVEENDKNINPFARRHGKTLSWRGVNMTVARRGGIKKVLSDVYGEVPEKEITAIMGPSGCGKTSLLNVLSGRMKTEGALTVKSDVRLDNFKVNPSSLEIRQQIAFVAQDDSLQITSTP